MCKEGIACFHRGVQGRIKNIRINNSKNNVVGDFTGNSSKESMLVTVSSLDFLNKKDEKKAQEIAKPFYEILYSMPEEKVAV